MTHVRLTEKPIRIGFSVTESAANTFTTATVPLPAIPSLAITRGDVKGLGVEIMKIVNQVGTPDLESGQNNQILCSLRKGATPGAIGAIQDNTQIYRRQLLFQSEQTTAVGDDSQAPDLIVHEDLTDGDGNGELVLDNEIHASIQGIGNANAKAWSGYMLCHLVEFTPNEVVLELLEQTQ